MREIKFRCLDEDGVWHYATLAELTSSIGFEYGIPSNVIAFAEGRYKSQFTGLEDSEGVEIYEGDIVEIQIYPTDFNRAHHEIRKTTNLRATIWFDPEGLCFAPKFLPRRSSAHPTMNPLYEMMRFRDCDSTVIGNIHEHPELLETK